MAGEFLKSLRQASFRGVPFAVLEERSTHGRRVALHEYPKRDKPWPEDMGRRTRLQSIRGFLVTDSRVYGGGDVVTQRERLVEAAEKPGPGLLVHPQLGDLTVTCQSLVVAARWNEGRYLEIEFSFIESGERVYPKPEPETQQKVEAKGLEAKLQAAEAWAKKATGALQRGSIAVQTALGTARQYLDRITTLGQDATGMFRLTGALVGSFGRYFGGRLVGGFTGAAQGLAGIAPLNSPSSTLGADLIGAGAARRALLALRGNAVLAAIGRLGQGGTMAEVADAVFDQVEALAEGALDPADRVRLLLDLAGFEIGQDLRVTAIGAALADLYRRAAVVNLAAAGAAYQPASFDDASDLLARLVAAIDVEIDRAGDAGEDGVFAALRAQRAALVEDLRRRGADLAPIAVFTTPAPMPAVVLAQRLYRDPARADGLIVQADPIHPLFMPVRFEALAN